MNDLTITSIRAREVLDCRGLPTVQVDLAVRDGAVVARPTYRVAARREATRPSSCVMEVTASVDSACWKQ